VAETSILDEKSRKELARVRKKGFIRQRVEGSWAKESNGRFKSWMENVVNEASDFVKWFENA
jgi:hypothetical protein